MEQYKKIFSSTRIPKKNRDELIKSSFTKNIIILYKNNIYLMDVIDQSGEIKSFGQIKNTLEGILKKREEGQGVGVLTSMDRDHWAETRNNLLNIDPINRKNIEKIESAIFAVCLDEGNPKTLEEVSKLMLYGAGNNRWYDKSIQFIITKNRYVGINMEHTGVDGSPMSNMIKYIYNNIDKPKELEESEEVEEIQKLEFKLNNDIIKTIDQSNKEFKDIALDNEIRSVIFDKFGTNTIKTFKVSPDAFIQLAIHLAQYKLYGKSYSVYEAVMTRKFLHGRIEVMYTVSNESFEFIKSIVTKSYSNDQRRALLKNAAKKHIDRIYQCQDGHGVDGHFMALIDIYNKYGKQLGINSLPQIFQDDGYKTLTHSTICTSTTLPQGLLLAGYGPVVEDGFSLRYIKDKEEIRFNVISRKYKKNDLQKLTYYLKESLLEMAELMEDNNG